MISSSLSVDIRGCFVSPGLGENDRQLGVTLTTSVAVDL